jgi:transcriptional regulator with XRE-family HTH domain
MKSRPVQNLVLTFNSTLKQNNIVSGKRTLGTEIRALRLQTKRSQRELADRVAKRLKEDDRSGFDFTYLSKIENDRLVPSAAVILALAAELNGNSDELLALAGKAPADIGEMFKKSEAARMFFRSALSTSLSEEDWKKLLKDIQKLK